VSSLGPLTEQVYAVVQSCFQHGHRPERLDVQESAYRKLMLEMSSPFDPIHFHVVEPDCGKESCMRIWRAQNIKVGDEPGMLLGIPVRIVSDPPPAVVAFSPSHNNHRAKEDR